MEQVLDGSKVKSSLLALNNDCVLEISKYLGLDDVINLSKTCHRLKDLAETTMFKKYSDLTIDRTMILRGQVYINNILSHIGPYVVELKCRLMDVSEQYFWSAINNKCKCLKKLSVEEWHDVTVHNFSNFYCFRTVEVLFLCDCNFNSKSNFLKSFGGLKTVICDNTGTASDALLLYNRNLKSFCFDSWVIDMRYFNNVPKLEALYINIPAVSEYKSLVDMKHLKKLGLWCSDRNINSLLSELAEKGIMEELELSCVRFDEHTSEILKTFTKVQLLSVYCDNNFEEYDFNIRPSFGWPPNLKHLSLDGIEISVDALISAIKQLKSLENVDLWRCGYEEGELSIFNDLNYLCRRILNVLESNHRNQRKILSIILPVDVDCSGDRSQVN